ncbi:MAG: protoheme IX farnesyltransferase [Actinobacteria bacterium]|nr:protoheme IX farnesyltransferase [Actinomycetota bacterium]
MSSRLFGHGDGKRRGASKKKRSKFGSYVALTKPRIIELLLVTTIPTMVLAAGKWPSVSLMAITLLGGSLAAGGANAINMYIDRDIDALMVRTQGRPLVTGDVSPRNALVFAVLLEIAAFAVLWSGANLLSALLALSATMFYVCIYSLWLKRTSKQNIVIGGAAGAVPVLVGWAAVQNSLGWAPVILFLVIFLWTPPHFWALAIRHSDDYRAAGVPMLPVVATMQETVRSMVIYSVILTVTSLVLVPVANLGYIYGITALLFGTLFILGSIRLGRDPSESRSMRLFSFSITYVSVLFMALTVDVLVN